MTDDARPRIGGLIGLIALFTLIGTPLVAFLWETLNRLMAGWFDPVRVAISVPALALLYLLLRYLGRATVRITT